MCLHECLHECVRECVSHSHAYCTVATICTVVTSVDTLWCVCE